jgi:hypothetical protein
MGAVVNNRQFSKILVDCDANPILPIRKTKYLFIPRIRLPVSNPLHLMTGRVQDLPHAFPDAGV